MQDSHIDSPNRPRAEHRADPSPVQLSIVPYPGLVRPKLYRVWLWAFPKVIRDVVLCSLQGKCALERSWLRTRVSRNLQPRQQQLFQKQVAPPRRRAEARSARLWPFCTRSFSSAITCCVEDWLAGNSVPTAVRDATASCASAITAGDCANWAWLLCVSPAAGPDDGDVRAAPVPFRAVQEGRSHKIFGNSGTCSS